MLRRSLLLVWLVAILGIVAPRLAWGAVADQAYDAMAVEVIKSSKAAADLDAKHTLEVFPSLRVERAEVVDGAYALTSQNEKVYLGGLGRVVVPTSSMPGDDPAQPARLLLQFGDSLGSTSVTIDHRTSEVVEQTTYDANGNTESDYRPARWGGFREDYRFTGKEEDIEVGLTYFGARYLNTNLRQWLSPDPLTIHGAAGDSNPYAYVGGMTLSAVDLWGLEGDKADFLDKAKAVAGAVAHAIGEFFSGSSGSSSPPQGGSRPPPPPPPPTREDPNDSAAALAAMGPATAGWAARPLRTGADGPKQWVGVATVTAGSGQQIVNASGSMGLAVSAGGSAAITTVPATPMVVGAVDGAGAAALRMSIWLGSRVPALVTGSTVIGSCAADANGNSLPGAGEAVALQGVERTVTVTSWAERGITPDLNPGRWVQLGEATWWNFLKTGLPGPKAYGLGRFPFIRIEGPKVPFPNSITGLVPASTLQWPQGMEAWKGILGQRVLKP